MKLSIIEVLCFVAIVQSLILGIYFISINGSKKQSNSILASILFIFVILIISTFLITHGAPIVFIKIAILMNHFSLLIAPLIFLYMRSLLDDSYIPGKKTGLHFIPFIIIEFYLFYNLFVIKNFVFGREIINDLISALFLTQSLIYISLCFFSFNVFSRKINNGKSKIYVQKLGWFITLV